MAREAEPEDLVGHTIGGKYRVEELLGRGGMGAVFRATNIQIGKRVALKFLTSEAAEDSGAVARFLREAQAASAAESPYIVQIFDAGETDEGVPYLVMEYLQGEDLRAVLKRQQRLPVSEVLRLLAQISKALVRAHEAGIVHRDLKPDNIFLVQGEDLPQVKIVDFGISKIKSTGLGDKTLTRRGTVLGTPYYMSPEQAQALELDGRADLFSLGAMVYEALTGEPPFNGPTYESVLVAICTRDAPDVREKNPGVSPEVAEVVARLLARAPEQRFASARALLNTLADLDKNLSIPSMHPRVPSVELAFDLANAKRAQRKGGFPLVPLVAGSLIAALGVAAFLVFGNGGFAGGGPAMTSVGASESSLRPRYNRRPATASSAAASTASGEAIPTVTPSATEAAGTAPLPSQGPAAGPAPAASPGPAASLSHPLPTATVPSRPVVPATAAPRPSAPVPGPVRPKAPGTAGGLELQTDP